MPYLLDWFLLGTFFSPFANDSSWVKFKVGVTPESEGEMHP